MNRYKIIFISLIISLFYFSFLFFILGKTKNIVYSSDFFYSIEPILEEEEKKEKETLDFNINSLAALSLKINKDGTEEIIYSKNENDILPIASLTKLMTALVVFDLKETYNPFQLVYISKKAASQEGVSILSEGESLTVESLIYITLIESSNDAAFALADSIGEDNFIKFMNLYAKKIGLEKTEFINSTGLSQENENISTAKDLSLLVKYIKNNYSEILDITKKDSYPIYNSNGILRHTSKNTNILLSEFSNIIGGKTGWTNNAKGCLIVLVEIPEEESYVINVVLGADNRFEEMRKLISILI